MKNVSSYMQEALPTSFDVAEAITPSAASGLSVDVLAAALKKALNGTPMLLDEQKVGEFVINTTERVVFA